jgi:hypothetical protein
VTRKPDHRGEHEISRKTIARGMPGDPGVTVVTMLVCFLFCRRGCGRGGRPAFPAPSEVRGREVPGKTRAHRRRDREAVCLLNPLFENRIRSNSSCASTRCTHRATRTAGSLPPCGGELERGVAASTAVAATPLPNPRKGGRECSPFARLCEPPTAMTGD